MEHYLLFGFFVFGGVVGAIVGYQAGAFLGQQVDRRGGEYVKDTWAAVGGTGGFAVGLLVTGRLMGF